MYASVFVIVLSHCPVPSPPPPRPFTPVPMQSLDGSFKAMAVSLPTGAELMDSIPGADPTLLYATRIYVLTKLAAALRPQLEALLTDNDSPPGGQRGRKGAGEALEGQGEVVRKRKRGVGRRDAMGTDNTGKERLMKGREGLGVMGRCF